MRSATEMFPGLSSTLFLSEYVTSTRWSASWCTLVSVALGKDAWPGSGFVGREAKRRRRERVCWEELVGAMRKASEVIYLMVLGDSWYALSGMMSS